MRFGVKSKSLIYFLLLSLCCLGNSCAQTEQGLTEFNKREARAFELGQDSNFAA